MAKKNFFALFVGVDKYDVVASLNGCVNDTLKMYNYLDRAVNRNEYNFQAKKLFSPHTTDVAYDDLPTRENILKYFKEYATPGKMNAGDIFFFFYAGHGSTEAAHPYFGEPNGEVQTLVPCNARTIGADGKKVRDVLDKEIRYLVNQIWEKSNKQAEIIIVQDSCHSTGATRSTLNDAEKKIAQSLLDIKKRASSEEISSEETVEYKEVSFEDTGDGMPDFSGGVGESVSPATVELVLEEGEKPMMRMVPGFGKENTGGESGAETRTAYVPLRDMSDMFIFDEETQKEIEAYATRGTVTTENNDNRTSPFITTRGSSEENTTRSAGTGVGTGAEIPFDKKFPQGNHIHLAACEKNQFAYETQLSDGKKGGVFTDTLVKILERSGGNVSYHEMFNRAKSMIDGVFNQTPSLYIFGDQFKRYEKFLGGQATVKEGEFNVSIQKRNGKDEWVVDAGALLGLKLLREGQSIAVTVFAVGNPKETYPANIEYVFAECSVLTFSATAPDRNANKLFKAYIDIAHFVNSPINVQIDNTVANPMNDYINQPEAEYFRTFVEWNGTRVGSPNYAVKVDGKGRFVLTKQGSEVPVVYPTANTTKQKALELMSYLKNISRWHQLLALETPHPGAKDMVRNHLFALILDTQEVLYATVSDAFPFYQWRYAKDFSSIGAGNNALVKKITLPLAGPTPIGGFKGSSNDANEYSFVARQIAQSAASEKNLYLGTMSLGYEYSIQSLSDSGSALFPPFENGNETQIKLAISQPNVVRQKLTTTVRGYFKFMLAYKRFDPSNWLQEALPEYAVNENELDNSSDATRAVLQLKAGTRAQDWIAYTLEIEFSTAVTKTTVGF